jgi:hypothetical protein
VQAATKRGGEKRSSARCGHVSAPMTANYIASLRPPAGAGSSLSRLPPQNTPVNLIEPQANKNIIQQENPHEIASYLRPGRRVGTQICEPKSLSSATTTNAFLSLLESSLRVAFELTSRVWPIYYSHWPGRHELTSGAHISFPSKENLLSRIVPVHFFIY